MRAIVFLFLLSAAAWAQPSFLLLSGPGDEMVLVMSRQDASGQVVRRHKDVYTTGRVASFEALRGRLGLGKMRSQAFAASKERVRWQSPEDGWSSYPVAGCIDVPESEMKPPTAAESAQFRQAVGQLREAGKLATQPISKSELKEISEKFREAGL